MVKRSGKLKLSAFLMIMTIVLVAAFQGYWLRKLYTEEWNTLKKETNVAFRDVVYTLQMQRFRKNAAFLKKDTAFFRTGVGNNLFMMNVLDSVIQLKDSAPGSVTRRDKQRFAISIQAEDRNDGRFPLPGVSDVLPPRPDSELPLVIRYLSSKDSATPPLSIGEIDSAYKKELLRNNITVPYVLQRIAGKEADLERPISADELKTGFLLVGLSNAYAYQATFSSPAVYILDKVRLPIIVGILLLTFTTVSLVFLYRNLVQQRQIAVIKNEFISNMTHELKTPISTVTVAVEALRHFGALDDRERAKEYLDISALELQRLSLLVDKVLKLSLFENRQIELKPERIDLPALAAEVMASMKLSLEKAGAVAQLTCSGEGLFVLADRMHLGSVISNLLDNAIKYSRERPMLSIHLAREGQDVRISVADNGIGIPAAYREKIFEKFFRVPSGDHHNIKGYGLGLSYVHHIITRHEGHITVESKEGRGSTFTIQLPAA
ncbi:sensor histidine kinase [Puia dinghuensis]|nr:HAMP domain-containing sensor histidine kinase [Puia dinghuensis]